MAGRATIVRGLCFVVFLIGFACCPARAEDSDKVYATLQEISPPNGTVEATSRRDPSFSRIGPPADFHQGAVVRTRTNTTAVVSMTLSQTTVRMRPLSTLEIQEPENHSSTLLDLWNGALYFLSRGVQRDVIIKSRHGTAAHVGTEFVINVDDEKTVIDVLDGTATLTNDIGGVTLEKGERGEARFGQMPTKTNHIAATNLVQWWLYYPAVVDANDLHFTEAEYNSLSNSIASYKLGDLSSAKANYPGYPTPTEPGSNDGKIYLASLYLSGGDVDKAEALFSNQHSSVAEALRWMVDAVQNNTNRAPEVHTSASEWLGLSYYYQARHDLNNALHAAKRSVELSTNFAFGWERVAELQFSFGETKAARDAVERSLDLAPRNAQAHALKGFLLSADNRLGEARSEFENAIALDPNLANGWLGRGLIRIRTGDSVGGRADLKMAAVLEPERSLLRSYLGKAYADDWQVKIADAELKRATGLDPKDPTPWLYAALLEHDENRINQAVDDLEKSIALNDNRAVYRSRFMLDEDQAVRSVNLAAIYSDASMPEVSVREATRAAEYDYANYSAHLFLSESFNALRDPTRFNLRYETVWFNELLLADLLSPVGGTPLSQYVSQQEYSRFFEQDRISIISSSEYRSDGQFHETASQYGNIGSIGWSLDLDYHHNDGVRVNNDLDSIEWYSTVKQQITPQDSILVLTKYEDYHSGDNFQYFYPTNARPNFKFDETQTPIVLFGYHREWQPGVHTLFLAGRLENAQQFSDKSAPQAILTDVANKVVSVDKLPFDVVYRSKLEAFTSEINQIFQGENYHLILGGRFQGGTFDSADRMTLSSTVDPTLIPFFETPPDARATSDTFERLSGYGYFTRQVVPHLFVTGGASYDRIVLPKNFRNPPLSSGSETRDRLNPKAALVWAPIPEVTVRGMFSHSLGGVSLDESFRLEPAQLAGFPQNFRSVISESLVGSVSAPTYDIAGAALDLKLKTRTYIGLQGNLLSSAIRQDIGVFDYTKNTLPPPPVVLPASTPERLEYNEQTFTLTLNQLISDEWSLGAQYRLTHSSLHTRYPDIDPAVSATADHTESAELHQATIFAQFNHSSGVFVRAETQWYYQDNSDLPTSDFYQCNAYCGYRFPRRHGDITFGLLDINGSDYHLNPLTLYEELPRKRTFITRLTFRF